MRVRKTFIHTFYTNFYVRKPHSPRHIYAHICVRKNSSKHIYTHLYLNDINSTRHIYCRNNLTALKTILAQLDIQDGMFKNRCLVLTSRAGRRGMCVAINEQRGMRRAMCMPENNNIIFWRKIYEVIFISSLCFQNILKPTLWYFNQENYVLIICCVQFISHFKYKQNRITFFSIYFIEYFWKKLVGKIFKILVTLKLHWSYRVGAVNLPVLDKKC